MNIDQTQLNTFITKKVLHVYTMDMSCILC